MEVLVLNTNFESVAVVDTFKSLIWTDRYKAFGDFEIYMSMEFEILNHLREDYYLWLTESEHCMIIENLAIDSDAEEGNYITITGRSLESLLERRIIWGQKVVKGNLQDAIKELITESIVKPTIVDRKIDNFIFQASSDTKITSLTVDTQFTGDDLYTVVTRLCEANDVGYKITLNSDNQFVFCLYAGLDRSYEQIENPYVIFSPKFDNIINSNYYTSNANLKNVTLVAGEGEGSSRKTAVVGSGLGVNRRELFTDARDISSDVDGGTLTPAQYTTLLEARGKENLSEFTVKTAFEGEVEATSLFKYGEDFFIGDIVQVANEYGHEGRAYISELIVSQSSDGISVYPTFQTIQKEGEETK